MRFAVPVTAVSEAEVFKRAGAGELYCGLLDQEWRERYSAHDSISRRQGLANLQSTEQLRELTRECTALGLPLFLALNSRYTPPQLPYLISLIQRFRDMGGTGVHMSDIGLMTACDGIDGLTLSASLMAVTLNAETLAFYRSLGVKRVVLPRCLSPEQMGRVLNGVPHIEGEAMVMADKCRFVDGYCRAYHGVGYVDAPCGDAPYGEIGTFDTTYRSHLCTRLLGEYDESVPCAACALERLERSGVTIGKLGGRGLPPEMRMKQLCFMIKAQSADSSEERRALYSEYFAEPCNCYY